MEAGDTHKIKKNYLWGSNLCLQALVSASQASYHYWTASRPDPDRVVEEILPFISYSHSVTRAVVTALEIFSGEVISGRDGRSEIRSGSDESSNRLSEGNGQTTSQHVQQDNPESSDTGKLS